MFSCLLQNNLPGGEMSFEIEFQTTFQHRGAYSATTMRTSILFLFYHDNKIELIENKMGWSVTSILYKTVEKAVTCCTLVILRMQTIGFLFKKKINLFYFFNRRCKCTFYKIFLLHDNKLIKNSFWCLSMKHHNRGTLTWNTNTT